jgi:hypothetical protein
MTARVGSFFAHVEQRDFAPFDQGGANGRSGDNAGHGESFWWALMGLHQWAGSAPGAIPQIGDGECREFMLCTKWIWKGVLWIATSAMSAFSHEG